MAKAEKIVRDPLYNYIAIDRKHDEWLIELLDAPEVQRLRRIHQVGVSHYTYPGADHSRLTHTLGVLHLMQQAWAHLQSMGETDPAIERGRHLLLAAAVLHDVGHGPFSHVFESCLEIDHEAWSSRIIRSPETAVHRILATYDIPAEHVADLIEKNNFRRPPWQKNLLSSELDVDRLDYLRRDSYFTGAGYGHFDWYRILNSFEIREWPQGRRILVWPDKAKYAIEEYVFARFYMYNNVYQHKTTRGFEKLLQAAWRRAKQLARDGGAPSWLEPVRAFVEAADPSIPQYLGLDDAVVLCQLHTWASHADKTLNDLSRRFLHRDGLAAIDPPESCQEAEGAAAGPDSASAWTSAQTEWEKALQELVRRNGYDFPEFYSLRDDLKLNIYAPYSSEKEEQEQSPYNAIFIQPVDGSEPMEISHVLPRLSAFTGKRPKRFRYYVPKEIRDSAEKLSASWKP
jgi:hypothetical protein